MGSAINLGLLGSNIANAVIEKRRIQCHIDIESVISYDIGVGGGGVFYPSGTCYAVMSFSSSNVHCSGQTKLFIPEYFKLLC